MEKFLLKGDTSVKLAENDGCSVYQLRNETGEGTITIKAGVPWVFPEKQHGGYPEFDYHRLK